MTHTNKNVTIAVLTITAALLLTVLWLTTAEPAVAAQAESRGESFALAVVRATTSQDLLYVIDMKTEQMNAYTVDKDTRSREIVLVAGPLDLQRLTQGAEAVRTPSR